MMKARVNKIELFILVIDHNNRHSKEKHFKIIPMDDSGYFIHFNTKEDCEKFKAIFNGNIEHSCCYGKGVKVTSFNLKPINISSYELIRKKYNIK